MVYSLSAYSHGNSTVVKTDAFMKSLSAKTLVSFETFHPISGPEQHPDEPFVWNGLVGVEKYRITCERIEEPKKVIAARLQDLWEKCDNHHNYGPLHAAAKQFEVELQGSPGSRLKRGPAS